MKTLPLFLSLILSLPLFAKDTIKGKVIEEEIPKGMLPSKIDFRRDPKILSIKSIVEKADDFLRQHFGKDFKLHIMGISLGKHKRTDGILWCWHVVYHYPQADEENKDKLLKIILSLEGSPLMSVTNIKDK